MVRLSRAYRILMVLVISSAMSVQAQIVRLVLILKEI